MAQQVVNPNSATKQCTLFVDLIPFRCGKDLQIIVDKSDDSEDENVKTMEEENVKTSKGDKGRKAKNIAKNKVNINQNKDNIFKKQDKTYSQHPICVDDSWLYPCKACGKIFENEKYRGMHVAFNHQTLDYGFACLGCGHFFTTDRSRERHWNFMDCKHF